jgi:hypothetical protein
MILICMCYFVTLFINNNVPGITLDFPVIIDGQCSSLYYETGTYYTRQGARVEGEEGSSDWVISLETNKLHQL